MRLTAYDKDPTIGKLRETVRNKTLQERERVS